MAQGSLTPAYLDETLRGTVARPGDVVTPAPWVLTGNGLVLLLRADRPRTGRGIAGRFSAVAFVDYESSDVGPYRELLHIPRVARIGDAVGPTVEHIWVTLHDSAVSGNANWGLTKTVADIERLAESDGAERWTAEDPGGSLGEVVHRPYGPRLPIGKPAGLGRLVQVRSGQRFQTPVGLRGLIRPTKVSEASLDPRRIADLSANRIVAAVSISSGTLSFGVPQIDPLGR